MTYSHFVVVGFLTFFTPWVISRSKKLSDTNTTPNIAIAAVFYILSQIAKLLFIATFLGEGTSNRFLWSQELLKSTLSAIDLVFFYFLFNSKILSGSNKDARVISVGLGWSVGENIVSRLIPLWMGATQSHFTWKWIQMGVLANIHILLYISVVSLMSLYTRKNVDENKVRMVTWGMLVYILIPFIHEGLIHFLKNDWISLIAYGAVVGAFYLLSLAFEHRKSE